MSNAYVKLKQILPPAPVLVGLVTEHHADDTSTVVLPTQEGRIEYAGGVAVGSTIRARGTTVAVGDKAFVRNGVIETRAPDGDAIEIEVGRVVPFTLPLVFAGPIDDLSGTVGAAFSEPLAGHWSGGVGALGFTVASGTLPAGLTLSAAGVLSGTPTAEGTAAGVVVRATDRAGYTADSNAFGFDVLEASVRWLAVVSGTVWYSDDYGTTWTSSGFTFPTTANNVRIIWGAGVFVAALNTNASNNVYTSPDGITWTQRTISPSDYRSSLAWNGSLFVIAGYQHASRILTSPDGITWTVRSVATENTPTFGQLSWATDIFYLSINTGATARAATSPDGINWTVITPPQLTGGVGWGRRALKIGSTYSLLPDTATPRFLTTANFTSFTQSINGSQNLTATPYTHGIANNGTTWVHVGSSGVLSTTDGSTFTLRLSGSFTTVFWTGARFVVLNTSGGYTSTDGVTWVATPAPPFSGISAAVAYSQA